MQPSTSPRGRHWGLSGPPVIALHGGPAAAGSVRDLARGLADRFRVSEPFQRTSGDEPLTVARHVADVEEQVAAWAQRPAIVGHSWGAMLALAYAAAHPERETPLALVGCGTFDEVARQRLRDILAERTTPELQQRKEELALRMAGDPQAVVELQRLSELVYQVDPLPSEPDPDAPEFDVLAHEQTWQDMLRQQEQGVYPAAFSAIRAPVIMLHGDYDPHPGTMIRDHLRPLIPQLEYVEFAHCGHDPWRERQAREPFFETLIDWLARHTG